MTPRQLKMQFPLTEKTAHMIDQARQSIAAILQKKSNKLLVVVGPCSIHDPKAAQEYAEKLKVEIEKYRETLCIIMRTYVEKSRTLFGWKGFIQDPDLNNQHNMTKGLMMSRSLLISINDSGVPCAAEILNPLTAFYYFDLLSWAGIGARTAESQIHREFASFLPMPVGFKNNTNGNVQVAIDSMQVAKKSHDFFSINEDGQIIQQHSLGNPHVHVILRGSQQSPNYDFAISEQAFFPLMIDCSHGNSQKDPQKQMRVVEIVCEYIRNGNRNIMGIMLESHLLSGKQVYHPHQPLTYGKSVTDACMGWKETEEALAKIHEAVRFMLN